MSNITWAVNEKGEGQIRLQGKMTVERASALHETFLATMRKCATTRVDLEQVEDVDLTFFQLICSGYKYAKKEGKMLSVTNIPSLVALKARRMGFTRKNMDGYFWRGEEHAQENHDG